MAGLPVDANGEYTGGFVELFTGYGVWTGVTVLSLCDTWAVGSFSNTGETGTHTLIEHWDGSSWTQVPTPSLQGTGYFLGVAAIASDDVWGVGVQGGYPFQTLTEHWDGSSWTVIPSPDPDDLEQLSGVSGSSGPDAWAVGWHSHSLGDVDHHPLIMHWDGSRWSLEQ